MVGNQSVTAAFDRVAAQVSGRLSSVDADILEPAEQRLLREVRRLLADIRLDLRDYEYADTRTELGRHAEAARKRFRRLLEAIVRSSESGVFGAADVAHLSAQLDDVASRLQRS